MCDTVILDLHKNIHHIEFETERKFIENLPIIILFYGRNGYFRLLSTFSFSLSFENIRQFSLLQTRIEQYYRCRSDLRRN